MQVTPSLSVCLSVCLSLYIYVLLILFLWRTLIDTDLVLTMVLVLSQWLGSKESARSAGNADSIPALGRFPGGGNGNPLQCSCLEHPMDRGAWRATVRGIAKSQTRLSTHTHMVLEEQDFKDEFSELVHVF